MKYKKTAKKLTGLLIIMLACVSFAKAQTAEVTVSLNEQFFDALLDAIFKNFDAPQFPLAEKSLESRVERTESRAENRESFGSGNGFAENQKLKTKNRTPICDESIRLLRDADDVRTAVRFRDGKIYAPIAFAGSYNPPLVGCLNFQGYAETNIDLEYDRQSRKLVGRVRVLSVNLGGVTNLASGVLSKLVQSSIDKKINPIEILQIDKLSFLVPIQNANGSLRMKATGVRPEIGSGTLNVNVAYEFSKN